ncbi:beta-glucosidase [Muriicola jejuensis]|nr:beta-glucosidase [Muriicola jejuensis]
MKVVPYDQATLLLSPKEKVGQFFMPAAFINDSEEEIRTLEGLIREGAVGGICFFHSRASAATNFEGKKKVIYNKKSYDLLRNLIDRYQKAAKYPLLISIDAEWGLAMRVEETPQYPYAMTLGAGEDPLLVYEIGKQIGQDCKAAGIQWNFAPVADINSNPDNPVIGYRSFGENKEKVSMNATAFSRGLQDAGTLSCAKHFPGHGDTATDSHLHLPVLSKSGSDLLAEELIPFQALIRNGVDAVMVGHIAVPALTNGTPVSASVSGEIIDGLLRKTLGYQGVVVSDALNMHSVSKAFPEKGSLEWTAFEAGTDVLCFAEHVGDGIDKILENATEKRIEESFKRVWRLKEKAFQSSGPVPSLSVPDTYNKMSARNSLTFHKGQQEILSEFRDKGFFAISMGKEKGVKFIRKLGLKRNSYLEVKGYPEFSHVQEKIGEGSRVLLSIFLPRAKPEGRFGLHEKTLDLIIRLIENYKVIVYLFGNPYFLRYLPQDKMEAIILCYQDLKGFEEIAAEHFLGQFEATGVLPVSI